MYLNDRVFVFFIFICSKIQMMQGNDIVVFFIFNKAKEHNVKSYGQLKHTNPFKRILCKK